MSISVSKGWEPASPCAVLIPEFSISLVSEVGLANLPSLFHSYIERGQSSGCEHWFLHVVCSGAAGPVTSECIFGMLNSWLHLGMY